MSDSVLLVSVSDLTSRLKLLNGLRVEDNKAFFDSVEAALAAAKALLASVEKALCRVEDIVSLSTASTPEPIDLSLSDVSDLSDMSANISVDSSTALIEELDKTSEKVKFAVPSVENLESSIEGDKTEAVVEFKPDLKEVAVESLANQMTKNRVIGQFFEHLS
jgi:hypothetical protein